MEYQVGDLYLVGFSSSIGLMNEYINEYFQVKIKYLLHIHLSCLNDSLLYITLPHLLIVLLTLYQSWSPR